MYDKLKNLETKGLWIDINQLWSDLAGEGKRIEIEQLIQAINNKELLEKLSETRNITKDVRQKVNKKIKIIKDQFRIIKRKLFDIKNLIFVDLLEDIKTMII